MSDSKDNKVKQILVLVDSYLLPCDLELHQKTSEGVTAANLHFKPLLRTEVSVYLI